MPEIQEHYGPQRTRKDDSDMLKTLLSVLFCGAMKQNVSVLWYVWS